MAGQGTGAPLSFCCSKCRRIWWQDRGDRGCVRRVVLTGRTKSKQDGRVSYRSTGTLREYRCLDCNHVGWNRHVDLERKARHEECSR